MLEDLELSGLGPVPSKEAIDQAIESRILEKTRQTISWVVTVFRSWCHAPDICERMDTMPGDCLAELLPNFGMEARHQDQTPYPPNTLVMLISGSQRHFRENGQPRVAMTDDKNARLARTGNTLDSRMKQLTREGVGKAVKQTGPLTPEQEDSLLVHCLVHEPKL